MKLSTLLSCLLAALCALGLTSCVDYESKITLESDGSGTIVETMIVQGEMYQQFKMAMDDEQSGPLAEQQYRDQISKMGEGVEFVKVEPIEEGEKGGVRAHYTFEDVTKLKFQGGMMSNMDPSGGDEEEQAFFATFDGKTLTLENKALKEAKDQVQDPEAELTPEEQMAKQMEKQMLEGMKEALQDMKVSMKLVLADGIKETNASFVEGDVITLVELPMGAVLADEKVSELLSQDVMDPEAFNAVDGVKLEPAEEITVELN